jgi:hypothetical protein
MTKKEFIIEQLSPYFINNKTCGYDESKKQCEYKTAAGLMCVAGKNFAEYKKEYEDNPIKDILEQYGQIIFKPEAQSVLTDREWAYMQQIHDGVAQWDVCDVIERIELLEKESKLELQELKDLYYKHLEVK